MNFNHNIKRYPRVPSIVLMPALCPTDFAKNPGALVSILVDYYAWIQYDNRFHSRRVPS